MGSSTEYTRQWRLANKEKVIANRKAYYAANKEKINRQSREWAKSHPEEARRSNQKTILKKYGLTLIEYDKLLSDQEGRCACCGSIDPKCRWKRFAVDHDHSTGKIRGLLCFECNTGIGNLGDSIEGLQKAINYLRGDRGDNA
jgi:hypothetical protein